jgi:ADP-heptose:LPS heptosyltransferase
LPEDFALLVPGSAAHRPAKRWPAARFAALAQTLARRGITPLLIGTAVERDALAAIAAACPEARDLCGQDDGPEDIAALARRARVAVGNDTGPMHLIAAAGCPVVSLFSGESDPAKVAPRGPRVAVLRRAKLADLPLEEVLAALPPDLPKPAVLAKSSEAKPNEREEAPPDE